MIKKIKIVNETPVKEENRSASFLSKARAYFDHSLIGQKKFTGVVFLLAIISIIVAIYFFFKFTELKQNSIEKIDSQTRELINRVSELVVLPQDETPTIATISDPEKLKDQPFFANAKKGYKVLIYANAKKAILYDPVKNKIIEIAPINLGQTAP